MAGWIRVVYALFGNVGWKLTVAVICLTRSGLAPFLGPRRCTICLRSLGAAREYHNPQPSLWQCTTKSEPAWFRGPGAPRGWRYPPGLSELPGCTSLRLIPARSPDETTREMHYHTHVAVRERVFIAV